MENLIPDRLTILGHPQRLALFRLLMRRYPDRVPAGEIAEALGVRANTLSNYLSALMTADLVEQRREGRSLLYRVNIASVRDTFDFLLRDCCRGRPDVCAPLSRAAPLARSGRGLRYHVLFLCTGNSARSILAEAILRTEAGDRFDAWSAGTRPAPGVHPAAAGLLQAQGHDISGLRPKAVAEVSGPDAPRFDFVFTVCDRAANEECPAWPGQPVSAHWGMPDPVAVAGTEAERGLAFRQTYRALKRRIGAFAALPVETLDRVALQAEADRIGRL
ncbi:arsenate reductase/protein-tyrosine-phosphatase family protein [Acidimangrovimonas sediminis]|uniref:arsenate reductase/protein-tyrosine-phosphatase family protein n=1 Tax=Acidimangrovimonas sediminis TaxID=2056283 RepID=UPI000C80145E|nr:helix-turn-helix domain-containing protein [Acidimangrovimonas sediminis]